MGLKGKRSKDLMVPLDGPVYGLTIDDQSRRSIRLDVIRFLRLSASNGRAFQMMGGAVGDSKALFVLADFIELPEQVSDEPQFGNLLRLRLCGALSFALPLPSWRQVL